MSRHEYIINRQQSSFMLLNNIRQMRYYFILLMVVFFSCKSQKNEQNNIGELPPKQNIEKLKETDFVATIENTFPDNKNYIYAPTLALAWNEIQDELREVSIVETKDSKDLFLLNTTKTNLHSLNKDEYTTEVSVNGDEIRAKAAFNLQLTFEPLLEKIEFPMKFLNTNVESFGMSEWDIAKANQLEIIYFADNENFIFKLKPKESNNELIFIRGLQSETANSFKDVIRIYNDKTALGKVEKKDKGQAWKYNLEYEETFAIPEISFNIEKSYPTIMGQSFTSSKGAYQITLATQRNALLLNNKGAKIESEAEIGVAAAVGPDEEPIKIKKHFILDSTFYLLIKHNDKENPYFCARISNAELMNKRQMNL